MTEATTKLSSWTRPVVVATVLAYRGSMGEQPEATVTYRAARDAFIAAGGDPDRICPVTAAFRCRAEPVF